MRSFRSSPTRCLLLALTASGVILALCSNQVIGFLQLVGQGVL